MFINKRIDDFSCNTILGIAITLYQYAYIDKRRNKKNKNMYKERLLKWVKKYNIPLELIVENAVN